MMCATTYAKCACPNQTGHVHSVLWPCAVRRKVFAYINIKHLNADAPTNLRCRSAQSPLGMSSTHASDRFDRDAASIITCYFLSTLKLYIFKSLLLCLMCNNWQHAIPVTCVVHMYLFNPCVANKHKLEMGYNTLI